MVRPVWEVAIDWANDGTFAGTGEVVTTRTLQRGGLSVQFGRDQSRALSPSASGTGGFELNNISRDYSPQNSGSPLFGVLNAGRDVRIRATWNAVTYDVAYMLLDDYDLDPSKLGRSVTVGLVDGMGLLRDSIISTALFQGIRTGEAITAILDAAGWPVGDRDIDPGATTCRYWWEEGTDAFSAIEKVVTSEGPPAIVYISPTGLFTFRDRNHRFLDAGSTTSQATFRDKTTEPKFSGLTYEVGWKDIVNSVTFAVEVRVPGDAGEVVWTTDDVIAIGASATITIAAQSSEPFFDAITPAVGYGDFTVLTGTVVSSSLSRDSGQSTIISLTAGAGGASIGGLRLRATPVPVLTTTQVQVEDATSITRYRRRTYPSAAPWAGVHDALAIAQTLVAQRKDRLPVIQMTVKSAETTRLTQQLARILSDRITVVETQTGLNNDFYIERIQHAADEVILATTFGCEMVPATLPTGQFILGTSVLNTGKLGT